MSSPPRPSTIARLTPNVWRGALLALYALTAVGLALQHAFSTRVGFDSYPIFAASWRHLRQGLDLYTWHADSPLLFKYSPSFAVLFAPVWVLPTALGMIAWNLLNSVFLFWAVERLLPRREATIALALAYPEMFGALTHAQSNALVAALVVLAFVAFEHRHELGAAMAIAVGTIVKIFPLAAVTLGILYPRRVRFGTWFTVTMLALLALPLLVVSPRELLWQYHNWAAQQAVDTRSLPNAGEVLLTSGLMGELRLWFGVTWPNWTVELVGTVLLLLPLARWRVWSAEGFRLRFLASLLVYMVLFNHRTETPTYVIAVVGIALWYVATPRDWLHDGVMVLTMVMVSLLSSDLTPHDLRIWLRPFQLKTLPCLVAWIVIQAELLGPRPGGARSEHPEVHELDVAAVESRAHGG